MILDKDFSDFIQLLNTNEVEYLVVGGYALALHGKPRHTGDLDIWINISNQNAKKLVQTIADFGMKSLGLVESDFLSPGYVTQIGLPPIRIDLLSSIDGLSFEDALKNKQQVIEDGMLIQYIGLHDLIRNKESSGREQDLIDAKELRKIVSDHKAK
ncbi:MAG: nucleotidyltransferase [Saprospiraceae bacterium]